MSTLMKRLISGIILLPCILACIWNGGWILNTLLLLTVGLAISEWFRLCIRSPLSVLKSNIWFISGLIYLLIAMWGFYQLRFLSLRLGLPEASLQLLLILVITITDTGAYFTGKFFKGPKLAPAISPNKTWSGAIGGLTATILFSFITLKIYDISFAQDAYFIKIYIAACACISLIGQVGDLLESFAKRHFQVKDSGNLIPGHGGILDRIDSVLAVSFFIGCAFLLLLLQS